MNRIILIGNGFDLAHGLKTSYKNFIDDFWEKKLSLFIKAHTEKQFRSLSNGIPQISPSYLYAYEDEDIFINISDYRNTLPLEIITQDISGSDKFNSFVSFFSLSRYEDNFRYKNKFLERITSEQQLENWVDIEEEYYSALIDCKENVLHIKKLNDDFSLIKTALQTYLLEQNAISITENHNIKHYIYSDFSKDDFLQLPSTDKVDKILVLNFNYTSTLLPYTYGARDTKLINIHGELNTPNNPIIFGYGDEIDDNYKIIEKENNNDFLKYIKSFHYAKNNNYRDMLNFINADEYQIYIMGLSCGTSDRTLLNTIFEHNHCKSIKIFYYIKNTEYDNYLDIYMNMSRNFTNKAKMRELVVSKENSLPLT